MEYNGKKEKIEYYDNEEKNDFFLIGEKICSSIKRIFKNETVVDERSLYSLGSKNPEHADVELCVNKETNSV